MELVSEGLIFIEIFFQSLGDCEIVVHILSWESLFWRLPVCNSSRLCVLFQRLYLEGRNGFSPFWLVNSDQLYVIKFS